MRDGLGDGDERIQSVKDRGRADVGIERTWPVLCIVQVKLSWHRKLVYMFMAAASIFFFLIFNTQRSSMSTLHLSLSFLLFTYATHYHNPRSRGARAVRRIY